MKLNQNKYCAILWKLSLPQGQPVWWSVTLQRRGFVSKIWIINRLGCCLAQMPKHNVIVETEKANCKVYSWKDRQKTLMICEPLISASNVTIYEDGVDDLSLCEVMITAIGEKYKRFLLQSKWLFNIIIIHQIQNQVIQRNIIIKYLYAVSLKRYPFGRAGTHVVHQKRGLDVDFEPRKTECSTLTWRNKNARIKNSE